MCRAFPPATSGMPSPLAHHSLMRAVASASVHSVPGGSKPGFSVGATFALDVPCVQHLQVVACCVAGPVTLITGGANQNARVATVLPAQDVLFVLSRGTAPHATGGAEDGAGGLAAIRNALPRHAGARKKHHAPSLALAAAPSLGPAAAPLSRCW